MDININQYTYFHEILWEYDSEHIYRKCTTKPRLNKHRLELFECFVRDFPLGGGVTDSIDRFLVCL